MKIIIAILLAGNSIYFLMGDVVKAAMINGVFAVGTGFMIWFLNRKTNKKVEAYHTEVNGNMEKLISAKKAEGKLEQIQETRDNKKQDILDIATAAALVKKAEDEKK